MNETTTARGLTLPCPCCHEAGACITLHLAEVDRFTCLECEEEFTTDDVREMIDRVKRWEKVLAWVDAMPSV